MVTKKKRKKKKKKSRIDRVEESGTGAVHHCQYEMQSPRYSGLVPLPRIPEKKGSSEKERAFFQMDNKS